MSRLCFEYDTEPYARQRDAAVTELAQQAGVEVQTPVSHTLYVSDTGRLLLLQGRLPNALCVGGGVALLD